MVDITYGAKKPSLEEFDHPETFYQPQTPVEKVLEVNAGYKECLQGDSLQARGKELSNHHK